MEWNGNRGGNEGMGIGREGRGRERVEGKKMEGEK